MMDRYGERHGARQTLSIQHVRFTWAIGLQILHVTAIWDVLVKVLRAFLLIIPG